MVRFCYFWTIFCYFSFLSLQELAVRHWNMLSEHSRSCFQICENASLHLLCCKHEKGLGLYGAECLCGFVLVCVLHPQLKKLGVVGTSHKVWVFTFSDCLLMLSYIHFKSSDISIGNLPGKFLQSLSKYFSLIWHCMFLFLFLLLLHIEH